MRMRRALPVLIVVAVALFQFRAALIGRVWRFEDIAGYFEPLWTAAARAMGDGRWPVWDGGAWSGQPLVGDPQLGAFYPPNWLWLVLPVLRAYAVAVALHAVLAGVGMYRLCRARGASREAAALGGVALAVGGYLVLQVRHIMFVECTAWVPWVALAGCSYLRTRAPRHLVGLATATGMMFLTGGVSMIYYALWFLGALFLAELLARDSDGRSRVWMAVALGAATVVGVLLAAPVLLPMAAHGPLSPRAQGTEYHFVASVAWRGWHYLPSLFLPNVLGQEVAGNYLGGGTQWEIAGYYAGVLPFLLCMYTFVQGARSGQRRGERIALGAVCLLAVLLAPGEHSPFHALAYRVLPLYASMRCPPRALYVFCFVVPLLAADGVDLLCSRIKWRPLPLLLLALTAGDLLLTHRKENPSSSLAEARAAAEPEALAMMQLHHEERFVNDVHARHDLHNAGLLLGVDGASGYSSLPVWRTLHYLWIANHGSVYPHGRLHDDLSAQGLWRFGSPLVDALAVRWLLTERPPSAPGWVKRFSASTSASSDHLDLWENLEAQPRAWVVHAVRTAASADEAAHIIADSSFDPRREAVWEGAPVAALAPSPSSAGGTGLGIVGGSTPASDSETFTRVVHSQVAMDYEGTLATDGLLVMAEPCYPGWSALVDGQPAALACADYALRGLVLTAGHHRVEVRYRCRPLERGFIVFGISLLGVLALLVVDLRRRRSAARAA